MSTTRSTGFSRCSVHAAHRQPWTSPRVHPPRSMKWRWPWLVRWTCTSHFATKARCRNTSVSAPPIPRCAIASASARRSPSTKVSSASISSSPRRRMSHAERQLHEYVAQVEGHESQVTGVVGFFYKMYRDEVRRRAGTLSGREILEIGCGEGMMFEATETMPVQMDVSMTRLDRARGKARYLLCADGYDLPFGDRAFKLVLLIAVLE